MDQFCTFYQAPSHTIHNCKPANAAKTCETAGKKGRDTVIIAPTSAAAANA